MTDLRRQHPGLAQPSMREVARHAGVAIGTGANTLNNPEKVRESTRQRVFASIDALGFVRNDAARSLAAGTSTTIGLVLVDMGNSFFVDIARGAEAAFRERGMNLLIANSDVAIEKQAGYLEVFEQARVAGILLAPLDTRLSGALRTKAVSRPLVLVNYASDDGSYSGVVADERHGGYLAARHLLELGRTRLVFAGGPFKLQAVAERLSGVLQAVGETPGATLQLVETTGMNISHGRSAGVQIIEGSEPRPDGIVAASDLVAIGIMQVLERSAGWRIPADVAVVGYDNNHFASESTTPVSTISQPGEEMGRAAAELLLEEITEGPSVKRRTVTLQPHLIARRSTVGDTERPE